jgi:hypothetical protein
MDAQTPAIDHKNINTREEIAFLLEGYQASDFSYRELHSLQRLTASLADWPLLRETLEPLLRAVQPPRSDKV